MPVRIYVINDPFLISFIEDNDLDDFNEYLDSDKTLMFGEPEIFETEAEVLAFCSSIGHGVDERAPRGAFSAPILRIRRPSVH